MRILLYRGYSNHKIRKLGEVRGLEDSRILWEKLISSIKWYGIMHEGEFYIIVQYDNDFWIIHIVSTDNIRMLEWYDILKESISLSVYKLKQLMSRLEKDDLFL